MVNPPWGLNHGECLRLHSATSIAASESDSDSISSQGSRSGVDMLEAFFILMIAFL